VLGELTALADRGALAVIFATKPGDGAIPQPGCEKLIPFLRYLPPGSVEEQSTAVAQTLRRLHVKGIHGYFAHDPADVALRAATLISLPFGFSVHARDARKVQPAALAQKAQHAACVVACNTDVAKEIKAPGAAVCLLPHGVDLQRFKPQPFPSASPLRLLAVGRLVPKKGFDVLVEAVAQLTFPFKLRIVGEGPEEEKLKRLVARFKLENCVTLCGGKTHRDLPAEYSEAHAVVVPSVVDETGDRDGLPNVVLEAMASRRPVVASDVGAIGSAVTQGETGVLLPPGDRFALASALEGIVRHPLICEQLGRNGRKRVESDYEVGRCTDRFYQLLEDAYA
jgi:glycosyltransferase involved in cell wall biosynthesis